MEIYQFIKKLNNTELGKGGTHDTYVLIPSSVDVSDIFDIPTNDYSFLDKKTKEQVNLKMTKGREKRITKIGKYYRDNKLCAGDEIIFERVKSGSKNQYYISVQKYPDRFYIRKSKDGFEFLVPERRTKFESQCNENKVNLEIKLLCSKKKRQDSPNSTDYYDILIDGESMLKTYKGKDVLELKCEGNKVVTYSFCGWKKYTFKVGD